MKELHLQNRQVVIGSEKNKWNVGVTVVDGEPTLYEPIMYDKIYIPFTLNRVIVLSKAMVRSDGGIDIELPEDRNGQSLFVTHLDLWAEEIDLMSRKDYDMQFLIA
jgi:hypothetical protein